MLDMIVKGDWLYSFDLKAGYHHVNVCESCQTYWVFHGFWEVDSNILFLLIKPCICLLPAY